MEVSVPGSLFAPAALRLVLPQGRRRVLWGWRGDRATASAMMKASAGLACRNGRSLGCDTSTDERLLAEMAAGDLTALETVFARHGAAVLLATMWMYLPTARPG
ncbi:MAG: hypothetical protein ABR540_14005 [Acidimicrobiales bacterium]